MKDKKDFLKKTEWVLGKTEEEIISRNQNMVRFVAKKYAQVADALDEDDLFQAGCIGLLYAMRNYDEKKNGHFDTYAYHCIRGYILKELRDYNHAVRLPARIAGEIREYKKRHDLDKNYTLRDFAKEKGRCYEPLSQALYASNEYYFLDAPLLVENDPHRKIQSNVLAYPKDPYSDIYFRELQRQLEVLLQKSGVSKRDQGILLKYYGFTGKKYTCKLLSDEYGLSGERIRQILHKTLEKISECEKSNHMELRSFLEDCEEVRR